VVSYSDLRNEATYLIKVVAMFAQYKFVYCIIAVMLSECCVLIDVHMLKHQAIIETEDVPMDTDIWSASNPYFGLVLSLKCLQISEMNILYVCVMCMMCC